jgi:hypothetical protein
VKHGKFLKNKLKEWAPCPRAIGGVDFAKEKAKTIQPGLNFGLHLLAGWFVVLWGDAEGK